MGERATGRRSSGAKEGEPMKVWWRKHRTGMAKDPHWCDMSVSQPDDPPTVRDVHKLQLGACYLPSAVVLNVIINVPRPPCSRTASPPHRQRT
jgi:hypothetical protein